MKGGEGCHGGLRYGSLEIQARCDGVIPALCR